MAAAWRDGGGSIFSSTTAAAYLRERLAAHGGPCGDRLVSHTRSLTVENFQRLHQDNGGALGEAIEVERANPLNYLHAMTHDVWAEYMAGRYLRCEAPMAPLPRRGIWLHPYPLGSFPATPADDDMILIDKGDTAYDIDRYAFILRRALYTDGTDDGYVASLLFAFTSGGRALQADPDEGVLTGRINVGADEETLFATAVDGIGAIVVFGSSFAVAPRLPPSEPMAVDDDNTTPSPKNPTSALNGGNRLASVAVPYQQWWQYDLDACLLADAAATAATCTGPPPPIFSRHRFMVVYAGIWHDHNRSDASCRRLVFALVEPLPVGTPHPDHYEKYVVCYTPASVASSAAVVAEAAKLEVISPADRRFLGVVDNPALFSLLWIRPNFFSNFDPSLDAVRLVNKETMVVRREWRPSPMRLFPSAHEIGIYDRDGRCREALSLTAPERVYMAACADPESGFWILYDEHCDYVGGMAGGLIMVNSDGKRPSRKLLHYEPARPARALPAPEWVAARFKAAAAATTTAALDRV